ncbi:DUF3014 domain-containing protein [Oceanicoccus sagamiensis]|uniref:DUF3014 domain-containing protein n=1 Tax=Oceanicoccus sagamiensis TaxID=716816 RepID=A0A1X9N666_9GAMM|nr:DUF3014 domain-containing protein [Oceanicoccus sagamiensis]ARN72761.1 hypothetical protein BST96_00705 [Oceanicoccus sagamiensis]
MTNKTMPGMILGTMAVVIIAAVIFVYNTNQDNTAIEVVPVTKAPVVREPVKPTPQPLPDPSPVAPPEVLTPTEAAPELPAIVNAPITLDNSDASVLMAARDLTPTLTKWLLPKEQIRKWVLAVDLMADGKLPKRYRPVDYPMAKFKTQASGLDEVTSDENYQRMNAMIETVTSIDQATLVRYYQEWLPLLEKAYREQGKPDTFNQRFLQTISQVLAVSPLEQQPALTRPSVLYQFESQEYESATDVEKLLWRMGPDNAEALQAFLRELRYQLQQ